MKYTPEELINIVSDSFGIEKNPGLNRDSKILSWLETSEFDLFSELILVNYKINPYNIMYKEKVPNKDLTFKELSKGIEAILERKK